MSTAGLLLAVATDGSGCKQLRVHQLSIPHPKLAATTRGCAHASTRDPLKTLIHTSGALWYLNQIVWLLNQISGSRLYAVQQTGREPVSINAACIVLLPGRGTASIIHPCWN